jgi:hypothetical protein
MRVELELFGHQDHSNGSKTGEQQTRRTGLWSGCGRSVRAGVHVSRRQPDSRGGNKTGWILHLAEVRGSRVSSGGGLRRASKGDCPNKPLARPSYSNCASDRAFRRDSLEVAPGLPDRNAGVVGVADGFQLVQCCCEDGADAFKHDEPRYFSAYAGSIAPWFAWVNRRVGGSYGDAGMGALGDRFGRRNGIKERGNS